MTWNNGTLPIHDHFDGSANCIQCNGGCQLRGAELLLTHIVRVMVEAWELYGQRPAYSVEAALTAVGIDLEEAFRVCRLIQQRGDKSGPRVKRSTKITEV